MDEIKICSESVENNRVKKGTGRDFFGLTKMAGMSAGFISGVEVQIETENVGSKNIENISSCES